MYSALEAGQAWPNHPEPAAPARPRRLRPCPPVWHRSNTAGITCAYIILPHPAGGTRFIGVYLARQLIEAGHEVTLLTRGKKPVTYRIPDDTGEACQGAGVWGGSSSGKCDSP